MSVKADRHDGDCDRQLCGPDDRSSSAGEADRANRTPRYRYRKSALAVLDLATSVGNCLRQER